MNQSDDRDTNEDQTRRRFLTTTATLSLVGATALAGCAGSEDEPATAVQGEANADTATEQSTQSPPQSTTTQQSTQSPTQTAPATDSATTPATDQGQSAQVKILEHEFYTDDYGGFGVKGKLKNVSGQTLSYVEVAVKFFDASGKRVAEGLDNMADLGAGQTATFDAMSLASIDPSTIEDYKLTTDVSSYPSADSSEKRVKVLEHEFYTEDYGGFGVKGTLKNVSNETLNYVEVSVVFYDDAGTRVGEGLDNMTDLSPGTKASFDAMGLATIDPDTIADYELTTDSTVY
jgi:hypothetical protein